MIVEVRIPRGGTGSSFVMTASEARHVADAGDVALVYETSDPKKTSAAYVWRNGHGYVVDAATFFPVPWHRRLRDILAAAQPEGADDG